MSKKKTFNVLSIDGGGIRGIIPAMILAKIEDRIKQETGKDKSISCLFDLVVGTSTGGILALGLSKNPPLPAKRLVEIYEKHGLKIFDPSSLQGFLSSLKELTGESEPITEMSFGQKAKDFLGKAVNIVAERGTDALSLLERLTDQRYSRKDLEEVFDCFFDEKLTLEDVATDTMVTCYDMETPEALFLKSWKTEHKCIRIRDAAFATSAAPTFFEPLPLCVAGKPRTLIDGGIFINSPAVSAYASARKIISKRTDLQDLCEKDIFVVSLGTGEFCSTATYSEAQDWGAGRWLVALLDYVSHSGPAAVDYQMRQFLCPDNYVRLQAKLDENRNEMDDASSENICYLKCQANKLIESCEKFERLYERLKERANEVCK